MKAPGVALYFQQTGFPDMYETAPVIMVVQPTTSLNQRENHPGGTSMTFLFASCKVTDVIANRSKEVVNAGDLVTIEIGRAHV